MIAVLVNCASIIAGALVGLLFSRKISGELSDIVQAGAGVVTLVIGFQMAFKYESIIVLTLSLLVGGILGSWWDIDGKILRLGRFLEKRFARAGSEGTEKAELAPQAPNAPLGGAAANAEPAPDAESAKPAEAAVTAKAFAANALQAEAAPVAATAEASAPSAESGGADSAQKAAANAGMGAGSHNFAYAFLNSSVLFCVGAMAVLGSFKAGIDKDYTLIFTKSILDGFMAIVFAAAMGTGTLASALSVLLYQGLLTLLSAWISPLVSEAMLTEISAVGGALVVMIGINLLKLRQLKTANYLPAVVLAALFVPLFAFLQA